LSPQMKLPPLPTLRSFEAVARTGSVSRAAGELSVTHSAVSHQIRRLEEFVGLPLVERNGRGIRLTPAGERLKPTLCEAFNMMSVELELLQQREASQLVRVHTLPLVAVSWLMPQMHDFWDRHPHIQLAIQYSRMRDTV